jgi:hypothetical protein
MASETEADAAARLEAALERIARLAQWPPATPELEGAGPIEREAEPARAVLIARLDRIIARLREALDQGP